mmetsp:Transcript_2697/g.5713  ORF Transcript_2697/g.5713 Transcript_2697/m.5713 type:complete len:227 (-) Transcript_2697:167-847(-)
MQNWSFFPLIKQIHDGLDHHPSAKPHIADNGEQHEHEHHHHAPDPHASVLPPQLNAGRHGHRRYQQKHAHVRQELGAGAVRPRQPREGPPPPLGAHPVEAAGAQEAPERHHLQGEDVRLLVVGRGALRVEVEEEEGGEDGVGHHRPVDPGRGDVRGPEDGPDLPVVVVVVVEMPRGEERRGGRSVDRGARARAVRPLLGEGRIADHAVRARGVRCVGRLRSRPHPE